MPGRFNSIGHAVIVRALLPVIKDHFLSDHGRMHRHELSDQERDKAYSSRAFRAYLRKRGIGHTTPEKADQQRRRHNRGRQGGRPPSFDRETYRRRNTVERCFNRLKHFRNVATRYDKTVTSYEAAISLASFLHWARSV